jgi:predicted aspartyl protease
MFFLPESSPPEAVVRRLPVSRGILKPIRAKEYVMGRIVSSVKIGNLADPSKSIRFDALVDTGSSFLVLPNAWRDRLGDLEVLDTINLETATQETVQGEVCGPVRIQIEGFRPIFNEVLFVEMRPEDGIYEPLIGYIVLEQSQAGVDMLGHRLVPIKHMDLK